MKRYVSLDFDIKSINPNTFLLETNFVYSL